MKHLIARTLTSLMLAVVGLTVTAPAQSMAIKVIRVNIPFEFNFGDKTFPWAITLAETMQHFRCCATRGDRPLPGHSP
jgi:hypothetical protein